MNKIRAIYAYVAAAVLLPFAITTLLVGGILAVWMTIAEWIKGLIDE
tara:strand:- start:360 stop:500 length:141 start_codon:yes stop_codon:yes gene_type:complete